jgi:hypothetical protein
VPAGCLPAQSTGGEGRSERTNEIWGLKYDCCTAVYGATHKTTQNDKMAGVVLVWCGAARLLAQVRAEKREGGVPRGWSVLRCQEVPRVSERSTIVSAGCVGWERI